MSSAMDSAHRSGIKYKSQETHLPFPEFSLEISTLIGSFLMEPIFIYLFILNLIFQNLSQALKVKLE